VICLHEEDCRQGIMNNCLWLDATDKILRNRSEYHQKYVLIEGVFNAKDKGHLGMYPGAIQKISRWYIWDSRGHRGVIFYSIASAFVLLIVATFYLLRLSRGRRRYNGQALNP